MPPAVILHRPQLGENIGAAARVMLNFGLTDLRLVAPRDGWPNPASGPMAAGAFSAGVTVTVFNALEPVLEGLSYVAAATARRRGIAKAVEDAGATARRIAARAGQGAFLFGAEKSGLPNEAVALCDAVMSYPVNPAFASLNLAQAVAVACAAWGEAAPELAPPDATLDPPASRDAVLRMMRHFEDELEAAGFFFPPGKTPVMKDNLRAALVRADWSEQEVRTFRGAVKALSRGRGQRLQKLAGAIEADGETGGDDRGDG